MIRIVRERNPRSCDGCGRTRLVVLFVLGSKQWRACTDCNRTQQALRDKVFTDNLDSVEAT